MHIRTSLNFLFPPFRKYELYILEYVINNVDIKIAPVLRRRLENVNYVQRLSKNKAITMFQIKHGKPYFEVNDQLNIDFEQWRLASVMYKTNNDPKMYRSDFWITNGYLTSMDFDYSPEIKKCDIICTS